MNADDAAQRPRLQSMCVSSRNTCLDPRGLQELCARCLRLQLDLNAFLFLFLHLDPDTSGESFAQSLTPVTRATPSGGTAPKLADLANSHDIDACKAACNSNPTLSPSRSQSSTYVSRAAVIPVAFSSIDGSNFNNCKEFPAPCSDAHQQPHQLGCSSNGRNALSSKPRQFLGSIEGAKSSPARHSSQVNRKPASRATRAPDSDDCAALETRSDDGQSESPDMSKWLTVAEPNDLGTAMQLQPQLAADISERDNDSCRESPEAGVGHTHAHTHTEAGVGHCAAVSPPVADSALAGDRQRLLLANAARSFRSKPAAPLLHYISASCSIGSRDMGVSKDERGELLRSSHLQPLADGTRLFDDASYAEFEVRPRSLRLSIAKILQAFRSAQPTDNTLYFSLVTAPAEP